MNKVTFLAIATLLRASSVALHAADAPQMKPNIVFIITDQQCADAMSCRMGSRYLTTPALDSLAQRGMFFTRAYSANPLCMPSGVVPRIPPANPMRPCFI